MRETLCGDRRAAGDAAGGAAFLERYYCRMWDVSAFMHGVKQRFTQWCKIRKGRNGTLWEDRFKSGVVEGADKALRALAVYRIFGLETDHPLLDDSSGINRPKPPAADRW
jgi:hypothetical protein